MDEELSVSSPICDTMPVAELTTSTHLYHSQTLGSQTCAVKYKVLAKLAGLFL